METIKLEYSEPLIKQAIRSYWWRQVGPGFIIVTLIGIMAFGYLLLNGDRSWLVGVVGAVVVLAITMMGTLYIVHLNRSLSKLRSMGEPQATLELGDHRFRVASGAGGSEIEWTLIEQVWRFKEVWLLFFSGGEFMILPTKNFNHQDLEFILSKLNQAGAQIM